MDVKKRIEIEKRIVRQLVQKMDAAGWTVKEVDYGEDIVPVVKVSDVIGAVFAVDVSTIRFFNAGGVSHVVQIVLGNDGWDCIADWSYSEKPGDTFNSVMEQMMEYANEQEGK